MYDNPLRIFSAEQLKRISYSNLKEIKNEIILEFQFGENFFANLNGNQVGKNTVLLIFEELEDRLHVYLQIENDPKLKSFFVKESLDLLKDEKAKGDLLEIIRVYDSVGLEAANILAKKVWLESGRHCLKSIRTNTAWKAFLNIFSLSDNGTDEKPSIECQNIKIICDFAESFSSTNHLIVFGLTFTYLENRIDKAKKIIDRCTDENSHFRFEDGLETYFNEGFIDLFDVLPSHFESLANTYTHYCKVTFVDPWIDHSVSNLGMYQLGIISAAANTVAKREPSSELIFFNAKMAAKHMYSSSCLGFSVLFFLILATVTISLLIIF